MFNLLYLYLIANYGSKTIYIPVGDRFVDFYPPPVFSGFVLLDLYYFSVQNL